MPSLAAAFVKLRSFATTRNQSRSLKSAFGTGASRGEGRDLCSWSIDASELPPLIRLIRRRYLSHDDVQFTCHSGRSLNTKTSSARNQSNDEAGRTAERSRCWQHQR